MRGPSLIFPLGHADGYPSKMVNSMIMAYDNVMTARAGNEEEERSV